VSYLKDLPCAGCGTESTYYFPDKPTAHYCYCEFRHEIGEQIAREIEERNSLILKTSQSLLTPAEIVERCAAIARGEK